MIFVDANVLLDIVTGDASWAEWSLTQLSQARSLGSLATNGIVYAEVSVGMDDIAQVDALFAAAELETVPVPNAALFLAGKAFARYRRAGGTRTSVLPDFFIGAQASVLGVPLLTRDARRYRTYFPQLQVITP